MSKYRAKRTEIDGNAFDSKVEGEYYRHLLKQQEHGFIERFELQPKFLLQEGFHKDGKFIRPINYVADFEVYFLDGTREIVDIKGMVTETAKLKIKLFHNKYPSEKLVLMKYVKKHGGWIELSEWQAIKKTEKKEKV